MSDHEAETAEKPPVSLRRRVFIWVGVLVLSLIAFAVVRYKVQQAREENQLNKALADLDENDPGWRLEELEAARASIPEERNSARMVVRAHSLTPKSALDFETMKQFDTLVPELLDKERLVLLEKEMRSVKAAVDVARRLADTPNGRHNLVHAINPLDTLLTDQEKTRAVCNLLRYDALLLAQKGEMKASLRSCQALLNAARSIGDEPMSISLLIRISGVSGACSSIERTLALGAPPREDLARLAKQVAEEEAHPSLVIAFRGERASQHKICQAIAQGAISSAGISGGGAPGGGWEEALSSWAMKRMIRREEPKMLAMLTRAVEIARLPCHEQDAGWKDLEEEMEKLPADAVMTRLLLPAVNKIANAFRRKVAFLRCTMVVLALEQHRQEKGTWPGKLEELTPRLLPAVPLDPFDGKLVRYKRTPEGVTVYSVGPDGKDDGGNLRNDRPQEPGGDLGYRLWNIEHRRQPAKPGERATGEKQ